MITGILDDYDLMTEGVHTGRYGARIDGQPYPVMQHVDSFLLRLQKGGRVDVVLNKEGWISKISKAKVAGNANSQADINKEREDYNAKAAKAGFVLPGKQDTCTSPEKPAPDIERINREAEEHGKKQRAEIAARKAAAETSLKTVEGQITALDIPAHKITIKTRDGQHHEMMWTGFLDEKMSQLKQWWFCKVTAEKDGEFWKVMDQGFFQRPADWPFAKGGAGGKPFQPRNERLIVLQSSLKVCADMFTACTTPDTQDYDQAIDMIVEKAIQITEKLMIAGGA
jgi:hypothetical protein